jgi:proteasome lid subunit RPN8/RPN11
MTARAEPRSQPMPLDRAILWNPPAAPGTTSPGRPSTRVPYPIFFQQEAVIALQEHLKSSPNQAIFGFLIGDLYRDPETGVLYIVIDKTLKLSQAIYGDKTEVVVSRLWDRMQEQLTKANAHLLGWYHSHPGQGGFLTAHDVETHDKYFTEPWHVAVLVAAEAGGVTGRFFRSGQNADWHKAPIAFYELLQPESIKPDGKKRSFITWRNYKAYGPTLTGPKPKAAAPESPPPPPPPAEPEPEPERLETTEQAQQKDLRIMRASADDLPVIRTSADDEPAPARPIEPVPPPPPSAPPPQPRQSISKVKPAAPAFVPAESPVPEPPKAPPVRRTSDDIPWAVTPESVASVPPPVLPIPSSPPPAAPRRISAPAFRLLDESEASRAAPKPRRRKRRSPWPRRFATLLVLAGIAAGGYWYVTQYHPALPPFLVGLVDAAKRLVTRTPAPGPQAASRRPSRAAGGTSRRAASPVARTTEPQAALPATPAFARFDRLSDSLSQAVRNFQDRAALFAGGRLDCAGLGAGLRTIETLWTNYNLEKRARSAAFDARRQSQDQAMWASVDSVERRYESSGCPRP